MTRNATNLSSLQHRQNVQKCYVPGEVAPMTKKDIVPENVPQILKTAEVARALSMPEGKVQTWFNTGALPYRQQQRSRRRYVSKYDLADFADGLGMTIDWDAISY